MMAVAGAGAASTSGPTFAVPPVVFFVLRIEFLLKTDSGYPMDAEVT